jgi:hypothetical protein
MRCCFFSFEGRTLKYKSNRNQKPQGEDGASQNKSGTALSTAMCTHMRIQGKALPEEKKKKRLFVFFQ